MPPLLPRRTWPSPAVVVARPAPAFPQRPRGRHPQVSNEATAGFAARYGLRGCARPFGRARQGTQRFRLPVTPPSSYLGALPTPRAGLPPASPTVSTAYGRCQVCQVAARRNERRDVDSNTGIRTRATVLRIEDTNGWAPCSNSTSPRNNWRGHRGYFLWTTALLSSSEPGHSMMARTGGARPAQTTPKKVESGTARMEQSRAASSAPEGSCILRRPLPLKSCRRARSWVLVNTLLSRVR